MSDRITAAIDALAEAEAGMTEGRWEEHGAEIITRNTSPLRVPWLTIVSECEEKSTGAGVVSAADNRGIVAWRNAAPAIVEVLRAAQAIGPADALCADDVPGCDETWDRVVTDLTAALARLADLVGQLTTRSASRSATPREW